MARTRPEKSLLQQGLFAKLAIDYEIAVTRSERNRQIMQPE